MYNHTFWETVAQWIVPQYCVLCRTPSYQFQVCQTCSEELPRAEFSWISTDNDEHPLLFRHPALQGVIAPLLYTHPIDNFIHSFKYKGQISWARTCATWIMSTWPTPEHDENPIWIPIPLHSSRHQERGYNQSLLLARALARRKGGQVVTDYLERVQTSLSSAQEKLSFEERSEQADSSFCIQLGRETPKKVYLVDDVLTTGATLSAATLALQEAGVESVIGCVVARTPKNPYLMKAPLL